MVWQQEHLEMDVNQRREEGLYFRCHVHIGSLGLRAQLRVGKVKLLLALVSSCHFVLENERR